MKNEEKNIENEMNTWENVRTFVHEIFHLYSNEIRWIENT